MDWRRDWRCCISWHCMLVLERWQSLDDGLDQIRWRKSNRMIHAFCRFSLVVDPLFVKRAFHSLLTLVNFVSFTYRIKSNVAKSIACESDWHRKNVDLVVLQRNLLLSSSFMCVYSYSGVLLFKDVHPCFLFSMQEGDSYVNWVFVIVEGKHESFPCL